MKKIKLLIFISPILFLLSCSKDDATPDAKNATIIGIEIITFPLTDGGSSWDLDGDGDPTFEITNSTTVLYSAPTYYQNVNSSNLPLSFTIASGYKLPILNQAYSIQLYDYDATSSNDYIGGISFNPNDYKSARPSSKTFATADIQIKVSFLWE